VSFEHLAAMQDNDPGRPIPAPRRTDASPNRIRDLPPPRRRITGCLRRSLRLRRNREPTVGLVHQQQGAARAARAPAGEAPTAGRLPPAQLRGLGRGRASVRPDLRQFLHVDPPRWRSAPRHAVCSPAVEQQGWRSPTASRFKRWAAETRCRARAEAPGQPDRRDMSWAHHLDAT